MNEMSGFFQYVLKQSVGNLSGVDGVVHVALCVHILQVVNSLWGAMGDHHCLARHLANSERCTCPVNTSFYSINNWKNLDISKKAKMYLKEHLTLDCQLFFMGIKVINSPSNQTEQIQNIWIIHSCEVISNVWTHLPVQEKEA